jgi:hypothetical protein
LFTLLLVSHKQSIFNYDRHVVILILYSRKIPFNR